jgi:hypothetical protein
MNEKRGNIDTWLKRAARQPGPGIDRKDEDEGWAGLSAMLDDDKKRPGIIAGATGLRLRRNRWLTLTAAALILCVLLLISLYRSKDIPRPSSNKALTRLTPGKTDNTARNNTGGGIVQQASPSSRPMQNEAPAQGLAGTVADHTPAHPPAGDITPENPPSLPAPAPPAQKEPDKAPDNRMTTGGLSLETIPLPNGNSLTLFGPGQHKWPTLPSLPDSTTPSPRWALQAGFLATNDEGLGARVSFMYRLPISRHFYLQPYIGAGYTGNYDKTIQHLQVLPIQNGTTGQYRTDSIWTYYKVKNVLNADAGIRVGYTLGQFAFGTGIRYHHMLQSKGDSASGRKLGPAPSGTTYRQAFSKADVPGRHSFYWEMEAAYQWRFGLQTGISYQFLLHENASPAWQPPVPAFNSGGSNSSTIPGFIIPAARNSLQDKGRLEIYLRLPLGKK